ncbi:hypothetical protein L3C95_30195 [Chitinophaga filiformis]|uniref:hypothetical protein n=1 Tax=Chitinophaga filiformis TaxID=104663 RepID=UPI001F482EE1|nr:hypothetical protein [Chitinophaga filiformis]MCF6407206.1 hypothetical protein [Chitinophaga filiformis]
MKERRLTHFCTKQFYYLALISLTTLSLGPGCRKSTQPDPCEDILSERPPTMVGLLFIDGQTGENILLSKNIDASAIAITVEGTDLPAQQGMIRKDSAAPAYGALVFHIADTKQGAFRYKINIPDVGSATLSYTNMKVKSDNKCNPYYMAVTDLAIEDHPFKPAGIVNRMLFEVTL